MRHPSPGLGYRLAQLAAVGTILGGLFDALVPRLLPHHEAWLGIEPGTAPPAVEELVLLILGTLGMVLVAAGGMALVLLAVWRRHGIPWAAWGAAGGITLAEGVNAWALSRLGSLFFLGPVLFPFLAVVGVWMSVRRDRPG